MKRVLKQNRLKLLVILSAAILVSIILPKSVSAASAELLKYENLNYILEENDEVTIVSADEDVVTLEIPSEIDGHKVTKIGHNGRDYNGALSGLEKLKSITIPDTVKVLGVDSFTGDSALEEIIMPDSITEIGSNFGGGLTSLKKIVFSKSIKEYPWHILVNTGVEEIVIPEGAEEIGLYAFSANNSLKSVTLPASVKTFNEGIFTIQGEDGSIVSDNLVFNVYKDSPAYTWVVNQGYNYKLIGESTKKQVLSDSKTDISIELATEDSAELKVVKITDNEAEYKELYNQLTNATAIGAYNISVVNGEYEGNIKLTFTVDKKYAGKDIFVLHKKASGEIERFKVKASDEGKVEITTTELSPFMLAVANGEDTVNGKTDDSKKVDDKKELDNTPKTGVKDISLLVAGVMVISACGIIILKKKN